MLKWANARNNSCARCHVAESYRRPITDRHDSPVTQLQRTDVAPIQCLLVIVSFVLLISRVMSSFNVLLLKDKRSPPCWRQYVRAACHVRGVSPMKTQCPPSVMFPVPETQMEMSEINTTTTDARLNIIKMTSLLVPLSFYCKTSDNLPILWIFG